MGIFDTDLVQKDLPLEDRIREKITTRVGGVMHAINERSARGVTFFERITKLDSKFESTINSNFLLNRYEAFIDYLSVSMEVLKKEIKDSPMIQDGNKVLIKHIFVSNSYYSYLGGIEPFSINVNVITEAKTGVFSFKIDNFNFKYTIFLDPPTCPLGRNLNFRFVL